MSQVKRAATDKDLFEAIKRNSAWESTVAAEGSGVIITRSELCRRLRSVHVKYRASVLLAPFNLLRRV